VAKLLKAVAGFDASVAAKSRKWLQVMLEHPAVAEAAQWQLAEAPNGAVVACCLPLHVGTTRTELILAVNPAWRRQGIGTAFMESLPKTRRYLVDSRSSVEGAAALLVNAGFEERYRHFIMRRPVGDEPHGKLPAWAKIDDDTTHDAERLRSADLLINGEDAETHLPLLEQRLSRPGARLLYMVTPKGDEGYASLIANEHSKKSEFDRNGAPTVGFLEHIGLSKAVRGKGLSRPLLRAALQAFAEDGYQQVEVLVDGRRKAAVDLYEHEGFEKTDEVIHWIRRDA